VHYPGLCCLACRWDERHRRCDQGGLIDPDRTVGWHCPRCKRDYTAGEYALAVRAAYDEHADYRTQTDCTQLTGVPRGTIQGWASRGQVRRRRDESGRTTYNVHDIRSRTDALQGACAMHNRTVVLGADTYVPTQVSEVGP
jgi:hypothetical protein